MSTPPTETDLLRALQLDATPRGVRLFRNQRGVYRLARPECMPCQKSGRVLQSGIGGNGGSDLLGWAPVVITPEMVGQTFSRFLAIEGKRVPRRVTEDQQRFLDAVAAAGGLACVAYHVDDLARLLKAQP